jgi:hypothetical protein
VVLELESEKGLEAVLLEVLEKELEPEWLNEHNNFGFELAKTLSIKRRK